MRCSAKLHRRVLPLLSVCLSAACSSSGSEGDAAATTLSLVALETTVVPGESAREPMIVETQDGRLFVAGYGADTPTLWRSDDGGGAWERVDVGSEADGAIGNSDVDLAVGPDGTLYFAAMTYDRERSEGRAIAVGSSRDGGTTWSWTTVSRDRFDDRPWVEVAPDGTAHVIWNDGAGVSHAVSRDGGRTWTERSRVHAIGGSSHLAISPSGTLAVRITPLSASGNRYDPGTDFVAISPDGGETWTSRELPGARTWTPSFDPADGVQRWVEPVAWDAVGSLFTLWSEGRSLWMGRSRDQGVTWQKWRIAEDTVDLYFPYLVARTTDELAATWYSGTGDAMRANVAAIFVGEGPDVPPSVARADTIAVAAYRFPSADAAEPIRDTAGEYVPLLFLRDGRLVIITSIQVGAEDRFGFTFRPYRIERQSSAPG